MELNLKKKTFFVSGSSKGIGLEISKKLLEENANVILNRRRKFYNLKKILYIVEYLNRQCWIWQLD